MGIWHRVGTAGSTFTPRSHRTSARTNVLGRRTLGLEALECRQLLSASVGVRFEFDTPGGTPVNSLAVGQNYVLKAFVEDIRTSNPVPPGVRQAYFNITFDAGVASVNGAIAHGADFNLNTDGTSGAGALTSIGGQDTDQSPPGAGVEELLFSVPLHIDNAGSLTLVPSLTVDSLKQVVHFDSAAIVPLSDINFTLNASTTLTIPAVAGPSVQSIVPANPTPTNATSVQYTVTFSESVTGVDTTDFTTVPTGPTGTSVANVTPVSGSVYTVTVNTGSGDGTLALKLADNDSINNSGNEPLGGSGAGNGDFTGTPAYDIDKTAPTVVLPIALTDPATTNLTSVHFTVAFDGPVSTPATSDFAVVTTGGITGASVSGVALASGNSYTVTVDTGTGDGTLKLRIPVGGTIKDSAGNGLAGLPIESSAYTIDKTGPTVVPPIALVDPTTNNLTSVHFTVAFDGPVSAPATSDFALVTTGGITGASVSGVAPAGGNSYTITVDTGSGDGTLKLRIPGAGTIKDSAGNPLTGSFPIDSSAYTIDKAPNNPPSGTDKTISTLEDTAYTFAAADFGYSDPDDDPANNFLAVQITLLPSAGSLTLDGAPVSQDQFVSIANITAGKLKFTPAANANGAGYASFQFKVQDDGGTFNGGQDTDPSANTITIDVTSVNDAPAGADKSVSTTAGTDYVFSVADFGFSDPDDTPGNSLLSVIIVSLPSSGTLTNNGVAVDPGDSILPISIGAGQLKYTPAPGTPPASTSFTFKVRDNGGTADGGENTDATANTITVNITPINHAPSGTDKTVTTVLNTEYIFSLSDFGFSDPNDSPADNFQAVKIASLPVVGTLTNGGSSVSMGQMISAADIAAGLFKFAPGAGEIGAPYASFIFQVQDDGGTAGGGQDTDQSANTMTVDVTLPNQPPAGTDKTVTTPEDTAYTFTVADFGFSDPSDTPPDNFLGVQVTALPAAGSLTLDGVAVAVDQFISVGDIAAGKLKFTPAANASGAEYAQFQFKVRDDGGTSGGGIDTDPTANTITVNVTSVNDAPSGADKTVTTLEDTAYTFATGDFGFSDPSDSPANNFQSVVVASLPTAGALTLDGAAVTLNQVISASDIAAGKFKFTPGTNANGATYAHFTFQVRDDGGTEGGGQDTDQTPNTITVNVTSVNDAPSGADKTVSTAQNVPYTFTAADFGFSDPNDSPANSLQAVKIATLPGAGSLMLSGVGVSAGQFVSSQDIAAGNLKFVPGAAAPASPFATFTFQVQDNGGTEAGGQDTDQSPNTMTVNVTAADTTPPTVVSINRVEPDPTNDSVVHFAVTFSESVSGVDLTDFQIVKPGDGNSIAGEFKASISGSGSSYTVTVNTGSGNGLLGLNLVDDNSIVDSANNPLGGPSAGDGNFAGQQYTVDRQVPTVISILADPPNPTSGSTATFQVKFAFGPVTGVDLSDFQLVPSSGISGASITGVSGSGSDYTVTINTGTGNGAIALKLVDNDTIVDDAGNPLGGTGTGNGDFTGALPLTVDRAPPTVTSINRVTGNPASTATVQFTVTFSENVTGVDTGDFALVPGGEVTGASITGVSGSGSTYTVTVSTGAGNGTLGLNLVDDDSIKDAAGLSLGGTGAGNGNLTGQVYTIARTNGISGFVYLDSNNNGTRDTSDVGLEGVLVTLYGTDNQNSNLPTRTTSTLSDGSYSFTDLTPGTYTVVESQPGKLGEGTTSEGSLGGAASGNSISSVTIAADSNGTNYNFGDTLPPALVSIEFFLASTPPIPQLYANIVASARTVGPLVTSFTRLDADPTTPSATVRFQLTFNYDVTGVDASDFTIMPGSGTSGGSFVSVTGSGNTYIVTTTAGSTAGKHQVGLFDDNSIKDGSGTPLANALSGNFFSEIYTVNQTSSLASALVDQAFASDDDLGSPH